MEIERILRITAGIIVLAVIVVTGFVVIGLNFSQGIGYDSRCELIWQYNYDNEYNESFFVGNTVMFEGGAICIELKYLTVNTTYRWYRGYQKMYQFIANETTHFFWMALYKGEMVGFQRRISDTNAVGQHQWEYLTLIEFYLIKYKE